MKHEKTKENQDKIIENVYGIPDKEENQKINHRILTHCPYCQGKLTKKGIRKKKYEDYEFFPLHVVYKLRKGKSIPKEQMRL